LNLRGARKKTPSGKEAHREGGKKIRLAKKKKDTKSGSREWGGGKRIKRNKQKSQKKDLATMGGEKTKMVEKEQGARMLCRGKRR